MSRHERIGARLGLLGGLVLAGCGGAAASTEDPGKTRDRQSIAATSHAGDEERASTTQEPPSPVLSMYVAGPLVETDAGPGHYWAEITLVNEGDAPADVTEARAHFEAWRGDERLACEPEASELEGPPAILPGDAIVYRATATCEGVTGEHEVRAHVSLAAEGAELRRERHYVGRGIAGQ